LLSIMVETPRTSFPTRHAAPADRRTGARAFAVVAFASLIGACAPADRSAVPAAADSVVRAPSDRAPLRFAAITAGRQFTCALDLEGTAWCWGANRVGQLGVGDTLDRYLPARVRSDVRFTRLVAGESHVCAADSAATLYCWGDNRDYALADTTVRYRSSPARITTVSNVREIALGANVTCVTDARDLAYCWGTDQHGERGDDGLGTRPRPDPRLVSGDHQFVRLTVGRQHACGLTARGEAWCWGDGGALGDGTLQDRGVPVRVPNRVFRDLAAGESVTCGLKADDSAWCWGIAYDGQLGQGSPPQPNTFLPSPVAGGVSFRQVAPGRHRVCALDVEGQAWCWGSNYNGALGDNSGQSQPQPVRVAGERRYSTITSGDSHTCAIDESGAAWCWGENTDQRGGGALGDGTVRSRPVPTPVAAPRE
jgi:alpha-tubulin suppressor-like RCC1 family protein